MYSKLLSAFCLCLLVTIMSLQGQNNVHLLAHMPFESLLSDISTYSTEDQEYAIISLYDGIALVDLSDQNNPILLHFIPGPSTQFRDTKVLGDYAYSGNESGGGISILDLSVLPELPTITTFDNNGSLSTVHNLIAKDEKLYVLGHNTSGGLQVYDLANPLEPTLLGEYNNFFIDDAFLRGDILYAALIFEGNIAAIDISDPSNPVPISLEESPGSKPHGTAVSENGDYLFVTDEAPEGWITAYDVSEVEEEMKQLGHYQSSYSEASIPNKVYVKNDFLFVAHYSDGLILLDASQPQNLVEVGYYDTSPLSGTGLVGCMGIDASLPSGLVIAGDQEEGLLLFCVDYQKAAFLSGNLTNVETGAPVFSASVQVENLNTTSSLLGEYALGVSDPGSYSLLISHPNFCPEVISNVCLQADMPTILDLSLSPSDMQCDTIYTTLTDSCINIPLVSSCTEPTTVEMAERELDLLLFPNPAHDMILWKIPKLAIEQVEWQIFDLQGNVLLHGSSKEVQRTIDLQGLSPGSYLFVLRGSSTTLTKRFCKLP